MKQIKLFQLKREIDVEKLKGKVTECPLCHNDHMVAIEDVKEIFQDKLEKLYTFVVQGSTQSSDNMAKSAFSTMKYRIELLFSELVEK